MTKRKENKGLRSIDYGARTMTMVPTPWLDGHGRYFQ
jgi:hypothetical protein